VPLEELEEHIKQKYAEKDTLQHEIDEARTIIDSVNVDKQTIEDFKELKNEMDKYHLEDPKEFLNVLRASINCLLVATLRSSGWCINPKFLEELDREV
jgi:hypothetical protein